jgi:5'-3' exonuclease
MRCATISAWSKARGGAQARYYREKLGVDPGDPAGVRAVVEAYIQVPGPAVIVLGCW